MKQDQKSTRCDISKPDIAKPNTAKPDTAKLDVAFDLMLLRDAIKKPMIFPTKADQIITST